MLHNKRRIRKDLEQLKSESSDEYTAGPIGDDIYKWNATILGPPHSPFENGSFSLSITIPNQYPFKPPTVRFITPIFHPNVTEHGCIGIPCLVSDWPQSYTISTVLVSIRALMHTPDMECIVEPNVAQIYRTNPKEYNHLARIWTKLYAQKRNQ